MTLQEFSNRAQFEAAFERLNSDIIQPARHDLQRLVSSFQEMSHNSSCVVPVVAPTPPVTCPSTFQTETFVEVDNKMAPSTQLCAVLAQASDIDATATSLLVTGHRGGSAAAAIATVEEFIDEERGHGVL